MVVCSMQSDIPLNELITDLGASPELFVTWSLRGDGGYPISDRIMGMRLTPNVSGQGRYHLVTKKCMLGRPCVNCRCRSPHHRFQLPKRTSLPSVQEVDATMRRSRHFKKCRLRLPSRLCPPLNKSSKERDEHHDAHQTAFCSR